MQKTRYTKSMTKKQPPSKLQMIRLRPAVHAALHERAAAFGFRGATLAQRIIEAALGFSHVGQPTAPYALRGDHVSVTDGRGTLFFVKGGDVL
jgi:hypothetical protein